MQTATNTPTSGAMPVEVPQSSEAHIEKQLQTAFDAPGDEGLNNKLAALHCMLVQIALDVRSNAPDLAHLKKGMVYLSFFHVSNPVVGFDMCPQDPRLALLIKAVYENLEGPLTQAVHRYERIRSTTCFRSRRESVSREDTLMREFAETLTFSHTGARRELTDIERANNNSCYARMDERRAQIRHLRQSRIALFEQATRRGIQSWQELLQQLATEVLVTKH